MYDSRMLKGVHAQTSGKHIFLTHSVGEEHDFPFRTGCIQFTVDLSSIVVHRIRSDAAGHTHTVVRWRTRRNHIRLYVPSKLVSRGSRPG